jgi:hypothetical protein
MSRLLMSPDVAAAAVARWKERQKKDVGAYFAAYAEALDAELWRRQYESLANRYPFILGNIKGN